jgi:tRNA-splicing endonuclease subunit Sen2
MSDASTAAATTSATNKSAIPKLKRKRNERRAPKQKRFAPRFAPGLPGRGAIERYTARFAGGSVWVMDATHASDLATRGSYGKGVLSRSVPDFVARQQRLQSSVQRTANNTSKQLVLRSAKVRGEKSSLAAVPTTMIDNGDDVEEYDPEAAIAANVVHDVELASLESQHVALQNELAYVSAPLMVGAMGEPLLLALEEAFFLQYALQCLDVITEDGVELTVEQAWRLYRRLDARFAEKYVSYQFHRSHGWCPKQGIKFGSDWILYKKGPLYHHASYQVIVTRLARESLVADERLVRTLTWAKVHHLNRLAEGVQKELLLTYVIDPAADSGVSLDSPDCIPHFSIREVALKRFIPSAEEKQLDEQ